MSIDIVVRYLSGCPSWQTALERVHAAAEQAGVSVRVVTQAVQTHEDAQQLGFTGSPTILVNGSDPFEVPGAVPALACRVYATHTGLSGSPSVEQLATALAHRAA